MADVLVYRLQALTGGASNALDGIDGNSLAGGELAFIHTSTKLLYIYQLNATSGQSESVPAIIAPDLNAGNKRWELLAAMNQSVLLPDTDNSHNLILQSGENLSADRILSIILGDAARSITLSGNPTLGDWFDQAVKAASSPTFGNITDSGLTASLPVFSDANKKLVSKSIADTLTALGLGDWFDQAVKAASSPTFGNITDSGLTASLPVFSDANKKLVSKSIADTLTALGLTSALVYKGVIDCSANPNYPAADAGHMYIVSVAGRIGGASGVVVEAGDSIICNADSTAAGDQAAVGAYWNAFQLNIDFANPPAIGETTPNTGKFTTVNELTLTKELTGFSLSGGSTSKKLAVPVDGVIGDWSWWGLKNLRLIEAHDSDHTQVVINKSAYNIPILIGDHWHVMTAAADVDSVDNLDTGSLAAGTDYYIYACTDGTTLSFKVSANATNPSGFDTFHSRKIGGFHTLCTAVGTISGHTLTGYAQKDILPASIWDLKHRARCGNNAGMVYDAKSNIWVDIYLASGTGASTVSVNGGTISDTRNWMDFVNDGGAVGKRLLKDMEFQLAAAGSNEETNIFASADPATTGGHSDTATRRMISNIGCEDCCGALWQWLLDQAYIYSGTTAYYGNLPGGKGSTYTNFAADPGASEVDNSDAGSDTKLVAGGDWSVAANAGSRSRSANISRWKAYSNVGARFASEPL